MDNANGGRDALQMEKCIGAVGLAVLTVRSSDTCVAQGTNDLAVVSTSALTNLVEGACGASLIDFLEFGESLVTERLLIETETSVGVGEELHGSARCIEYHDGLFTFEAEITCREKRIATAQVQRRLVDRLSYSARIAAERLL